MQSPSHNRASLYIARPLHPRITTQSNPKISWPGPTCSAQLSARAPISPSSSSSSLSNTSASILAFSASCRLIAAAMNSCARVGAVVGPWVAAGFALESRLAWPAACAAGLRRASVRPSPNSAVHPRAPFFNLLCTAKARRLQPHQAVRFSASHRSSSHQTATKVCMLLLPDVVIHKAVAQTSTRQGACPGELGSAVVRAELRTELRNGRAGGGPRGRASRSR